MADSFDVIKDEKRTVITRVPDSEAGGFESVKSEKYFHGFIPQKLTSNVLKKKGDFLVRQALKAETMKDGSKSSKQDQFIISVCVQDAPTEEKVEEKPSILYWLGSRLYSWLFGQEWVEKKMNDSFFMRNIDSVVQAVENPIGKKCKEQKWILDGIGWPYQYCIVFDSDHKKLDAEESEKRQKAEKAKEKEKEEKLKRKKEMTEIEKQQAQKEKLEQDRIAHIQIRYSRRAKLYHVHKFGFRLVSGLIEYHRRREQPLIYEIENDKEKKVYTAYLRNPIKRAPWQLNREQIHKGRRIGGGNFGSVNIGQMRRRSFWTIPVAIKTTTEQATTEEENEVFFKEAMLMLNLEHVNVARFYGVSCNERPAMIVMEFASGGSVAQLMSRYHVPQCLQERLILGASRGLQYIHDREILHRDIAARNVLVGDNYEAKITDFGLSMFGKEKKMPKLGKVANAWLAYETLSMLNYSRKTDVWSFGVFMWEMFNNNMDVYIDLPDVKKIIKAYLGANMRMKRGEDFPDYLWALTTMCWQRNPDFRPTFEECTLFIESNYINSAFEAWKAFNGKLDLRSNCEAAIQ